MRRRAGTALVLAALASAALTTAAPAAPTTAVSLRGTLADGNPFTVVAALERVGPARLRVVVMRLDSLPSDHVYDLVMLRGRACGSRPRAGRIGVTNADVLDLRRRVRPGTLRGGLTLAIVERGTSSGGVLACARARWGRAGEIVIPHDTLNGLPIGVVAIWVPQGSPVVAGRALLDVHAGDFVLGASERRCTGRFGEPHVFQWRTDLDEGFARFTQRPWRFGATRSMVAVDTAGDPEARPFACAPLRLDRSMAAAIQRR